MNYLINAFRGFCMALADSVPGVSGGTIAFILGFYDKFINSLNDLFYGGMTEKKEAIIFLIKLGIGWIIGMVLASLVLTSLFEKEIYNISSLFLGFIVFSIPLIIKEEKEYFNSVLEKLKSEHKQIVADKQEIDLQLGAGIRTGRRKEDFEKKEERAEE